MVRFHASSTYRSSHCDFGDKQEGEEESNEFHTEWLLFWLRGESKGEYYELWELQRNRRIGKTFLFLLSSGNLWESVEPRPRHKFERRNRLQFIPKIHLNFFYERAVFRQNASKLYHMTNTKFHFGICWVVARWVIELIHCRILSLLHVPLLVREW